MINRIRLDSYDQSHYSRGRNNAVVLLWWFVQGTIFRFSIHNMYGWRRFLLKLFGARIGTKVQIRSTAKFTYPWNVEIGDYSWVGDQVELYSLDKIVIGKHCIVSQNSYLCTGSHELQDPRFSLITKPIMVKDGAWVASDVFVCPGVVIHEMAVAGARSTVMKPIPANEIHAGTPAQFIRYRFEETEAYEQEENRVCH